MKIGLISSAVPLIQGGGRFIVDWLQRKLEEEGHSVCPVYIPSADDPSTLLQQMTAFRLLELDEHFDRVITFRPPSHVVRHRNKVVWFIHHIRVFYDLWDSPYCPVPHLAPGEALRAAVMRADTAALQEARLVFTNSRVVGDRLRRFNGVESQVLYPPILDPASFYDGDLGDEVVCISRVEPHKRQLLLVEAMKHVHSAVRLRLSGLSTNASYIKAIEDLIRVENLEKRIMFDNRWITEAEKVELLAHSLAAIYIPADEDSYGYPTLEAAHASRCTVTLTDSGGTLEFVEDGVTGLVVEPTPRAIASALDLLHADRAAARRLGAASRERVASLGISWQNVIERVLA